MSNELKKDHLIGMAEGAKKVARMLIEDNKAAQRELDAYKQAIADHCVELGLEDGAALSKSLRLRLEAILAANTQVERQP